MPHLMKLPSRAHRQANRGRLASDRTACRRLFKHLGVLRKGCDILQAPRSTAQGPRPA